MFKWIATRINAWKVYRASQMATRSNDRGYEFARVLLNAHVDPAYLRTLVQEQRTETVEDWAEGALDAIDDWETHERMVAESGRTGVQDDAEA